MKKQVKNPTELKALKNSIRGVEKKPLPHVLCATNMMVHGIEVPSNIVNNNTLAKPLRDYGRGDQVDVIVTNPPFGGVEEDGIENNFPAEFRTKETADLFLVLVIELLKEGGRAAIVLPDGFMYGEGVKTRIKQRLMGECNVHTVVKLPNSVFKPYASIGTSLLFFEKGTPTQDVWFYEHLVPSFQKAYSKTRPIKREYLQPIVEWWGGADRAGRVENDFAWKMSYDELVSRNFNLDIKNPNSAIEDYGASESLMKDFENIKGELNNSIHKLQIELESLFGL